MLRGKPLAIAAVALFAVLSASGCAPASSSVRAHNASAASTSNDSSFRVTGFAEAGDTTTSQLKASSKAMTMVGVDGVNLTPDAGGITDVDPSAIALLTESHKLGEKSELLFGNYDDSIGDFSDPLAEKMFASDSKMDAVVADLASEVTKDGWDGITIDLESLNGFGAEGHTRDDNAGLDTFLTKLKTALGTASVSICLVATPDPENDYADYGYDLDVIGAQADHVVLMSYDQHGPTWSNAGPVGGYPWVTASAKLLAKGIPASKIQLGIAGYGYSWAHGKIETGAGHQAASSNYTDRQARAKVKAEHAKAYWSTTQKEWHATFKNGTVIWWSDARSYAARKALAKSLHLGGIAVWSLSGSDPLK